MGKRLDALLGRGFKIAKFKATMSLAVSRLAVLKNVRQARCSIARSDVVEFLKTNNHERALMRVEQVIMDQNMLDVFVIVDGYFHLLLERVNLIEQEKNCPEELEEAVSSLLFAATRCGEFPELQEIRAILTIRFGKEFAARAVELRNNCGVNPKVIQKLSTRKPSYENKMKMIKEIASDNNIDLPVEDTISETTMGHKELGQEDKQMPGPSGPSSPSGLADTSMRRRKYKDVADAAQAAFESAAYAAEAARAAVELSRSGSTDPDGSSGGSKAHPVQNYDSEASDDDVVMTTGATKRSLSDSSSGSVSDKDGEIKKQREVVFDDESEDDSDEGGKRVDEKMINEIKEPLNIHRRPISVRTTRIH